LTALDVGILVFTALMAAMGWRQGFVVGALSLAGFVGGALLGSRLAPLALADGAASPYAPLLGLGGAVLGGVLVASGLEGVGTWMRRVLRRIPVLGGLDGFLGAGFSAALALSLAWVAGAVALHTPGATGLRRDIQRSEILARLNRALPPSGPLLNALARFDPVPSIDGPSAGVPAPVAAAARDPEVAAAGRSAVRVLGTACGLGLAGSGWVAEGGLVVTNAHVIAGQEDTAVQVRGGGDRLRAVPVVFDPRNDVAVLRVENLQGVPALALASDPEVGASAAILGFPGNGAFDARAARVGGTRGVLTQDAYGDGPVERRITTFRGRVRAGNSGGPVVDRDGRVVATVFAAARTGDPGTGYGVPNREVRAALDEAAARGRGQVSTGPCAS
jgi:S1-C subfamily serine protease